MTDTSQLIESLSAQATKVAPLASPRALFVKLAACLLVYLALALVVQGLRPDLLLQMQRPLFMAELVGMVAVMFTSLWAAVCMLYPDQYQQPAPLRHPLMALAFFVGVLVVSFVAPFDVRMQVSGNPMHGLECLYCLLEVAVLPVIIMLMLARRGASVVPRHLGMVAALIAAAVGCLVLRLEEANDLPLHLLLWHYLPTFVLAGLGALTGKALLKW